jgi:prepilin-type N-terminal cleavage/methylation domain-containing protein/prepilin-type processing-associated H-X9-DG protein
MAKTCRSGFTLVEMLVVLAVLGILSAVLVPVFAQARAKSRQSVCISNLKQLGAAVTMYAADYDDRLPYAEDMSDKLAVFKGTQAAPPSWPNLADIRTVLMPYKAAIELYRCPQDHVTTEVSAVLGGKPSWYEYCGSSYYYEQDIALEGQTLSGFARPSESMLFFDYQAFHSGMVSASFADGHAKAHSYADWNHMVCITDPDAGGCENAQN